MSGFKQVAFMASLFFAMPTFAADWQPLFNGKDLSGWQAVNNKLENWKVDGDTFYCASGGGWLATEKAYANFELEVEFKLPEGGNSGVFLRAPLEGDPAWKGMELQMLDDNSPQYKDLQPYQFCGGLYGLEAPTAKAAKDHGEWQKYYIKCDGRKLLVMLNGVEVHNCDLDSFKDKAAKNPGVLRDKGYIGLQEHGGRVDFRNVKIKELP